MQTLKNQLPRIFQANLHRFYERVVRPGLDGLAPPASLAVGETDSMDEFLWRATGQVENYTSNEAAKAYTLILSALFERQMRIWAVHLLPTPRQPNVQVQWFKDLLVDCASAAGVDIGQQGIRTDLIEAYLVANVVRHGDGRSCDELQAICPRLWIYDPAEYIDILAGPSPASERILIRPEDVTRYVRAGLRFWGRADPLPMAVAEPPI
jgi:hypothetical protein